MVDETIKTDVLVIGGGGAGSRAAYEAKRLDPELDVLLVTEGAWGRAGSTVWVASETLGINAPLDAAEDGDSPDAFFDDIVTTGLGLADPHLARIVADESADRIRELIELGVKFDSRGDRLIQRKLSGCTRARSLAVGGETGVAMVGALKRAALEAGVQTLENIRLLDLIHVNGEVWGARGFRSGQELAILAKAVILANGGAGALFPRNINHPCLRGDGYAMAYRAGARLTNMELFQIGPGVVFSKFPFIIHSHMWNFRPRLRNISEKEFLSDYLPAGVSKDQVLSLKSMSFPFSVRTDARYLDIAMSKEITGGRGSRHGGVYFDVNHVDEANLREKAPITFHTFLKNGVNLARDTIEIAPLVQNYNGGVKIDEHAATTVNGLFAVGEVSGGVHGADRPGGNNLSDTQVFGFRGGRAAARLAGQRGDWPRDLTLADSPRQEPNAAGRDLIRAGMDRALMVVRRRDELVQLLDRIRELREKNPDLDIETDNLALNAEIMAGSALLRTESRGIHYREDFPETDPNLTRPSLVYRKETGEMACLFG